MIGNKQQLANRLLTRVENFPPLPAFIGRIMALNADPESSLTEISRVVEAEVSLAGAVIKLANSPLFGLAHRVSSVPHAISLLGRNELMNLVLSQTMFQSYKGFQEKKHHIAALRLHCFQCGLVARYLGDRIGLSGSGLFVAGLVHDVGKIIIYLTFTEPVLDQLYTDDLYFHNDIAAEEENLGIGHTTLGVTLIQSWMFPPELQSAVAFHHLPGQAKEYEIFPIIIHSANILVRILAARKQDDRKPEELYHQLLTDPGNYLLKKAGLTITRENIENLLVAVEDMLTEQSDLIEMFTH